MIAMAADRRDRQLPLPLRWTAGAAAPQPRFITGASNGAAVRHLARHAWWPQPATILIGPARSGRSLLGRIFADESGARVIDTLRDADEEAVFHAWNAAQAARRPMLVIADSADDVAAVRLADLATRLATAPVITIDDPDGGLAAALIERLLAERGLAASAGLGEFVAARIERSYAALHAAVDAIDAASLSSARRATPALARAAITGAGLLCDGDEP